MTRKELHQAKNDIAKKMKQLEDMPTPEMVAEAKRVMPSLVNHTRESMTRCIIVDMLDRLIPTF